MTIEAASHQSIMDSVRTKLDALGISRDRYIFAVKDFPSKAQTQETLIHSLFGALEALEAQAAQEPGNTCVFAFAELTQKMEEDLQEIVSDLGPEHCSYQHGELRIDKAVIHYHLNQIIHFLQSLLGHPGIMLRNTGTKIICESVVRKHPTETTQQPATEKSAR